MKLVIMYLESAHRWFKNGDHPLDGNERFTDGEFKGELYEGQVVRYFRHPEISGYHRCVECNKAMHDHGWIDQDGTGYKVCPGDYIVSKDNRVFYPIKPHVFNNLFTYIDQDDSFIKPSYSERVYEWLNKAFENIAPQVIDCPNERNIRFMEEAIELVHTCGLSKESVLKIVDYVYARPKGELLHELGGVCTTLSLLAKIHGININEAAELELQRDYDIIELIRQKWLNKPNFSTNIMTTVQSDQSDLLGR